MVSFIKGLTPKQAQFVVEYLVDENATQAAIRAGYSKKTAHVIGQENLRKPAIFKAVKEQLNARAEKTLITAEYVLTGFKEVSERCRQKKPVMIFNNQTKKYKQATETVEHEDGSVTEEGVWQFDSTGANRALESLARHLSLFNDKPVVDNSVHNHYTLIQELHEKAKRPTSLRVD